jgi:hypothetical protein
MKILNRLSWLGSELVLGILITVLSVGTAYASYTGAMADSDQNKYEIQGMKALNDGNTSYLEANQNLSQDYAYFDNWYTNDGVDQDKSDYYLEQMSDELAALATSETMDEAAWDAYQQGIFADSLQLFDRADASFAMATAFDEKGDSLQLVMLFMALGLAFAAWASLLNAESNLRPMFAFFAIITLVAAVVTYFGIPAIPTIDIPLDPFA